MKNESSVNNDLINEKSCNKLYQTDNGIYFEISETKPSFTRSNPQTMARVLTLYGIYRNGLYDARVINTLDADMANFKPKFDYEHTNDAVAINNNLYHYSSYIAIDAIQELLTKENSKHCIAYKLSGNKKIAVGFVVFYEKKLGDKSFLYISHVSSGMRGIGIGTNLCRAVIASAPVETNFYLCLRKFNHGLVKFYHQLGFIDNDSYVSEFGYSSKYFCGMSFTSTQQYIADCEAQLNPSDEKYSCYLTPN